MLYSLMTIFVVGSTYKIIFYLFPHITHRLPAAGMGHGRPKGVIARTCDSTRTLQVGPGPGNLKNTQRLPVSITNHKELASWVWGIFS
jgi:hypothetical protein